MRDFRKAIAGGWAWSGHGEKTPDAVWIDSGWAESQGAVYAFCLESGQRFRPTKGYGSTQKRVYSKPRKKGAVVRLIGEEYHIAKLPKSRTFLVEINSDHWNSFAHERLAASADKPGAMTLFRSPNPNGHISISKHFTAERKVQEFAVGTGRFGYGRWQHNQLRPERDRFNDPNASTESKRGKRNLKNQETLKKRFEIY